MWKKLTLMVALLGLAMLLVLPLTADPRPHSHGGGGGGGQPPPDPAIAFDALHSSSGTLDLMVANADGSNQTVLLAGASNFFFPSWSPLGGSLVFEQFDADPFPGLLSLWLIDVLVIDGQLQVGVPEPLVGDAFLPAWSPRGDLIAYVGNHDNPEGIFVIDPFTGVSTLVVPDPVPDPFGNFDAGWPAWSPDGTQLAYTWHDPETFEWSIRIKDVVNPDTGAVIDGPEFTVINTGSRDAEGLDWSRGGQSLAYKLHPLQALRIVDIESGFESPIPVTDSAGSPTWSPTNESEIVFWNRRGQAGSGKRRIVRRNLITEEETVLVERKGYHLYWPDWRRF